MRAPLRLRAERIVTDAPRLPRMLLWIDCTAGLTVGALVLALTPWLSRLYAIAPAIVTTMGIANLAYGTFSLSLARRRVRPPALITTLVVANGAWAVLCVIAAAVLAPTASALGVGQLLFEALCVGGLAALEWRHRALL